MLVALRLAEGPTVLSLARLHVPGSDSPEVCAIHQALECVLDADMHVIVETAWGRAEFRPSGEEFMYQGLYPCVSIRRCTSSAPGSQQTVLCCAMGPMARHAVWDCLYLLHPRTRDGDLVEAGAVCAPSVLSVAVAVQHVTRVWTAPEPS